MPNYRKIINDPVYGFITIDHPLIFDIISHPWYQRLRRIYQMALAQMVYPGAVHTRLHHSLGAYHLMCRAVSELKAKGNDISPEEELAVKTGILLHDIGHGPFSHALENILVKDVSHETLSLRIMHELNEEFGGRLQTTIEIFTGKYPKPFLHQLISGQLDVDRMDYLTRDSFYTGVSEGVIGYDRILNMLAIKDNNLVVEEKGIYSVEKFLVARRQMYWQVYLHKTVMAAEKMLIKIMQRAREIYAAGDDLIKINHTLDYFFTQFSQMDDEALQLFCQLDDYDVMFAIKKWSSHPDYILSLLCSNLLQRKLYKCSIQSKPVNNEWLLHQQQQLAAHHNISEEEATYFIFSGVAANTTYSNENENINILQKNGTVTDISAVQNPLIDSTHAMPVKKFYICRLS